MHRLVEFLQRYVHKLHADQAVSLKPNIVDSAFGCWEYLVECKPVEADDLRAAGGVLDGAHLVLQLLHEAGVVRVVELVGDEADSLKQPFVLRDPKEL